MGAIFSFERLACGHYERSKLTKSNQNDLQKLKKKLENAVSEKEYASKEITEALIRIEKLKIKFLFEISHNFNELNEIKKIFEYVLTILHFYNRFATDAKNLKLMRKGDICRNCWRKFNLNLFWSSESWNNRNGIKNKIDENLKIILELEKIQVSEL